MRNILVIGAGKSASSLVKYLLDNASKENWHVTVGDLKKETPEALVGNHPSGKAMAFNALDEKQRHLQLEKADIVISMLPAKFHVEVAIDCIRLKKNMITPSYITPEMQALDSSAKQSDVIILNEIGVDPGIDHMSAKRVLDRINEAGGKMLIFESFTGGLIAPESDNNPWNYKFTWNPRNVVLAGQGGAAKFIQQGKYKYIPYNKLFRRTEIIDIEGFGKFEGYANRDSLRYRDIYNLHGIPTIYRGTLRKPGFCKAWNMFVLLGATDDSYVIEDSEHMTYRQFINSFLAYNPHDSVELKFRQYLHLDQDDPIYEKLEWFDIFKDIEIGLKDASPAQILQKILQQKWQLGPEDKDMIVMWHRFLFEKDNALTEINASMTYLGTDSIYTAMSKTVGLPVAIACKMILNGIITKKGVHLPINKNIYNPILDELKQNSIAFVEKEVEPKDY